MSMIHPFGTFDRNRLTKLTFTLAFLILLYRLLNQGLISQLVAPPLIYPGIDRTYWLLLFSGIPQFISDNRIVALIFDATLLLSCILSISLNRRRIFPVVFTLTIALYFLLFNVYAGHHYHGLIGVLLVSIPFCFNKDKSFWLAWDGVRYYLLFIFVSAALWKIFRGSVFEVDQMVNIMKAQHGDFLYQQAGSWQANFISGLIQNPAISHWLLAGVVVLQISFVVGFFTRRWDYLLFICSLLFHIGNFLVMRVFSFELLILNLALLPNRGR